VGSTPDPGMDLAFSVITETQVVVTADARLGINTAAPTAPLDIAGDTLRVRRPRTPASATAPCLQGELSWDGSYVYLCVANNVWKRTALASW